MCPDCTIGLRKINGLEKFSPKPWYLTYRQNVNVRLSIERAYQAEVSSFVGVATLIIPPIRKV